MTVIDLSNRSTTSRRIPEIDCMYAYATRHKAKLTHRHEPGIGYRYTNHNAVIKAGEGEIHIYHCTVTIRGVCKGLTMVTKNAKFRDVQRFFNEQIVAIEANDRLFNLFSNAKATPQDLGIYFSY